MNKEKLYYSLDENSQLEMFTKYVYEAFVDGHSAVLLKTNYKDFLIIKTTDPVENNMFLLIDTNPRGNKIQSSFHLLSLVVGDIMSLAETIYSIKGVDYSVDY